MTPTSYPEANDLLRELMPSIEDELGACLLGLYLYGSATGSHFHPAASDVDLLAVVRDEIDAERFFALERMHRAFEDSQPRWRDRIEAQYVSAGALHMFKTRTSRIAAISPGDPFSYKMAGSDWTANWYDVQENGITLVGPSPTTWIPPITPEEFVAAVVWYAAEVAARATGRPRTRGVEAYEVLTMCRAFYTVRTGGPISKEAAASWAQRALPEWSDVIATAVRFRNDYPSRLDPCDPQLAAQMQSFVAAIAARIRGNGI